MCVCLTLCIWSSFVLVYTRLWVNHWLVGVFNLSCLSPSLQETNSQNSTNPWPILGQVLLVFFPLSVSCFSPSRSMKVYQHRSSLLSQWIKCSWPLLESEASAGWLSDWPIDSDSDALLDLFFSFQTESWSLRQNRTTNPRTWCLVPLLFLVSTSNSIPAFFLRSSFSSELLCLSTQTSNCSLTWNLNEQTVSI